MFLSFPLLLISSGFFQRSSLGVTACLGGFAELNASSLLRLSVILYWKEARGDPGRWGSNPAAKGSSICAPAVWTMIPEHSIPARGSLSSSSQGQIPLPLALGACMASFQLQTQHLPAVISRTTSLSHSMSALWHPRHRNGWWEEMEQGEGHLSSDWQPRSSEDRPVCFCVCCSYILNVMDWLPGVSSVCSQEPILALRWIQAARHFDQGSTKSNVLVQALAVSNSIS